MHRPPGELWRTGPDGFYPDSVGVAIERHPLKIDIAKLIAKYLDYSSLQEAILAWRDLPPEQKVRATVKVVRGPVYAAYQIDRLCYEPKPA